YLYRSGSRDIRGNVYLYRDAIPYRDSLSDLELHLPVFPADSSHSDTYPYSLQFEIRISKFEFPKYLPRSTFCIFSRIRMDTDHCVRLFHLFSLQQLQLHLDFPMTDPKTKPAVVLAVDAVLLLARKKFGLRKHT